MAGKAVADLIEAILGAVYLENGLAKTKEVMDVLGLISQQTIKKRKMDRDGVVMLDDGDMERPAKRRRTERVIQQTLDRDGFVMFENAEIERPKFTPCAEPKKKPVFAALLAKDAPDEEGFHMWRSTFPRGRGLTTRQTR